MVAVRKNRTAGVFRGFFASALCPYIYIVNVHPPAVPQIAVLE